MKTSVKTSAYHWSCLKQLLEPVWPLVTCLHDKLAEVYFGFKKSEKIIDIYEEICKKADERFQSVYDEAVRLTNKLGTADKSNKIPLESVKQYF